MKNKLLIVILSIIALFLVLFFFYRGSETNNKNEIIVKDDDFSNIEKKAEKEEFSEPSEKIHIDIKGAVKNPGVYEVNSDSRVIDVIQVAGGLIKGANTNYINLSEKITDEMVIWIYSDKEIEELLLEKNSTKYMISECNCPVVDNTTCLDINKEEKITNDDKININKANLEELSKLNGIGELKARNIIEYREKNGKYSSIEDIMKVSGIGEAAYNKIKDYIEV